MATDELTVRGQLRDALGTVRPLLTMSREGMVLTALEWTVARPAAYETATAAARSGELELREQGGHDRHLAPQSPRFEQRKERLLLLDHVHLDKKVNIRHKNRVGIKLAEQPQGIF